MSNQIAKLLFKVLREYGVPITYRTIEQCIKVHPDYPLIQSISDVLDVWKVKHVSMKLSLEELRALKVPTIVFLNNKRYIWVTKVTDSNVYFFDDSGKETIESSDRFEQEWTGVALAIENIDDAGDPNYKEVHKEEIKEK